MVSPESTEEEREQARQLYLERLRMQKDRVVETRLAHSWNEDHLRRLVDVMKEQTLPDTTHKLIIDADFFRGVYDPSLNQLVDFLQNSPTVTDVHLCYLHDFDLDTMDDADFMAIVGPVIEICERFLLALSETPALCKLTMEGLVLSNLRTSVRTALKNQRLRHIAILADNFLYDDKEFLIPLCQHAHVRSIGLTGDLRIWQKMSPEQAGKKPWQEWYGGKWVRDPTGGTTLDSMMQGLRANKNLECFVWAKHGLNEVAVERLKSALVSVENVSIDKPNAVFDSQLDEQWEVPF